MKKLFLFIIFALFLSGGTIDNVGKPDRSLYITCEIANEYSIDDNIKILIKFGTALNKSNFDWGTRDNPIDRYNAELSMINKKSIQSAEEEKKYILNPLSVDERIIIAIFDDFYEENYPLIKRQEFVLSSCSNRTTYNTSSSIEYNIPKSLLIDETGVIIINLNVIAFDDCAIIKLEYRIKDDSIFFNKL